MKIFFKLSTFAVIALTLIFSTNYVVTASATPANYVSKPAASSSQKKVTIKKSFTNLQTIPASINYTDKQGWTGVLHRTGAPPKLDESSSTDEHLAYEYYFSGIIKK